MNLRSIRACPEVVAFYESLHGRKKAPAVHGNVLDLTRDTVEENVDNNGQTKEAKGLVHGESSSWIKVKRGSLLGSARTTATTSTSVKTATVLKRRRKDVPIGSSNRLSGKTFVITGVLESLQRNDAIQFIKSNGGRVTTGVSGKTSYLVSGKTLEDGRDASEGSKTRDAKSRGIPIITESELFDMVTKRSKSTMRDDGGELLSGLTAGDLEWSSAEEGLPA